MSRKGPAKAERRTNTEMCGPNNRGMMSYESSSYLAGEMKVSVRS